MWGSTATCTKVGTPAVGVSHDSLHPVPAVSICIPPRNLSASTHHYFQNNSYTSFSSSHHLIPSPSSSPHAATGDHDERTHPRPADMMATMPLLTPSEAHAFQSFLEHVDYSDAVAPEWAMYTNDVHDELADDNKPCLRPPNDPLTRATKDLMSLDTNPIKYGKSAPADRHMPFDLNANLAFNLKPSSPTRSEQHLHNFPDFSGLTSPHLQRLPLTVAPSRTTLDSSASSDSHGSLSDLTPPPSTPPSLKRPYPSIADPSKFAGPSSGVRARSSSASTSGPRYQPVVLSAPLCHCRRCTFSTHLNLSSARRTTHREQKHKLFMNFLGVIILLQHGLSNLSQVAYRLKSDVLHLHILNHCHPEMP